MHIWAPDLDTKFGQCSITQLILVYNFNSHNSTKCFLIIHFMTISLLFFWRYLSIHLSILDQILFETFYRLQDSSCQAPISSIYLSYAPRMTISLSKLWWWPLPFSTIFSILFFTAFCLHKWNLDSNVTSVFPNKMYVVLALMIHILV